MRRLLVDLLGPGDITIPPDQAHHARSVLRLEVGDRVELFDRSGRTGQGHIICLDPQVIVRIDTLLETPLTNPLVVASAVPKGDRSDWLVEKLSEIGVDSWIPLRTERSVVHPDGVAKFSRWERLAQEAAKQSRRTGVMRIQPLTDLKSMIQQGISGSAIVLTTGPYPPLTRFASISSSVTLIIGPEGGWSQTEIKYFQEISLTMACLTCTILRIETAAVVSAGILACGKTV